MNVEVYARFEIKNREDRSRLVSILADAGYIVRIREERNKTFPERVETYWVEVLLPGSGEEFIIQQPSGDDLFIPPKGGRK